MARVTLIRGDGIGPEIMEAAIVVLEATGAKLEWDERYAGTMAIETVRYALDGGEGDPIEIRGILAIG
jgi:isocitrate/isopropylmalate dehydrogenase